MHSARVARSSSRIAIACARARCSGASLASAQRLPTTMTAAAVDKVDDSSSNRLFRFGVLSDVQYAPIPDGKSHGGTPRYYRNALQILSQAVDHFMEQDVEFVCHLGDIVDGFNPKGPCGTGVDALDTVIAEFDRLGEKPHYHMLGNHCLYNCPRPMLNERLKIPEPPSGASYYSFQPYDGFRFIVLDCYDLSVLGWPELHPKRERALQILRERNPNVNKNSPEGLQGLDKRFVMFGGGVSEEQLEWLEAELAAAQQGGETVVVFGHLPLHPESAPSVCLLWNYDEVLRILEAYSCVVLTLAGHTHADGYGQGSGLHHRVLSAVLECPPGTVSFGHMDVFPDRIELLGVDRMASATYPYTRKQQTTEEQASSSDGEQQLVGAGVATLDSGARVASAAAAASVAVERGEEEPLGAAVQSQQGVGQVMRENAVAGKQHSSGAAGGGAGSGQQATATTGSGGAASPLATRNSASL